MGERTNGTYFGVYENPEAGGKRPDQTGTLLVDADLLQALIDMAHAQQEVGQAISVEMRLGFWVKTGRESNKDYLWGRPSVWVTDDPQPPQARKPQIAQERVSPRKDANDDIPF